MRLRTPAAVAAAAALLAGCGSTAPPSLVQLRAQGMRICASTDASLGRIGTPRTAAGGAPFLKHGVSVLGPELRELRTLHAPAAAADVYRAAVQALASELGALRSAVHALQHQQDPVIAFKTLQQHLRPLETQANDAWQALQMPACLEG